MTSETINKEPLALHTLQPGEREEIGHKIRGIMPSLLKAIDANADYFGQRFPDAACKNGFYPVIDNIEWTTSFWTGQLWLAYEWTGEAIIPTITTWVFSTACPAWRVSV